MLTLIVLSAGVDTIETIETPGQYLLALEVLGPVAVVLRIRNWIFQPLGAAWMCTAGESVSGLRDMVMGTKTLTTPQTEINGTLINLPEHPVLALLSKELQ